MAAVALGIVGFGIMGERLLRAALAHNESTLKVAGVWDPSPDAMARLTATAPQVPHLASADALIAAADCVYIASPPATHLEHARQALAQDRAVLCEKPLAVDLSAARAFAATTQQGGSRIAVNFPFASSFAVDQLLLWISEGEIGQPQTLHIEVSFARWPRAWQRDAAGWLARREQGGFTREVVSHFLFLARRLLGPLRLQNHSVEYPPGDGSETAIHAELMAGTVAVRIDGRVGGTDADDHNAWTLQGTKGAIRLRDWSFAEEHNRQGYWREAPGAMANEKMRPLVLRRQLDKVARMAEGEAHSLATVGEALEVQETVEAILRG